MEEWVWLVSNPIFEYEDKKMLHAKQAYNDFKVDNKEDYFYLLNFYSSDIVRDLMVGMNTDYCRMTLELET
jgi:hypothetical protein